jgi:hypothetical protein
MSYVLNTKRHIPAHYTVRALSASVRKDKETDPSTVATVAGAILLLLELFT